MIFFFGHRFASLVVPTHKFGHRFVALVFPKPWNYKLLSANPNITWEIVRDNPERPWDYKLLHVSIDEKYNEDEVQYTEDEVQYICQKIYLDEIAGVFKSDVFFDDKVDVGFKKVFDLLMENDDFKKYIENLTISYTYGNNLDEDAYIALTNKLSNNAKYFSFLSLFNSKIFYLTHILISDYLTTKLINDDILTKIKNINDILS